MNEALDNSLLTRSRRLSDAIRQVKNAAADRDDVVVDMREASRTRLELLAAELEDVFAGVPADDPLFDFAISSGLQPRLWIDATAHVAMGRDRRAYRFVRDTRLGRVVLVETHDIRQAAEAVTRYVAERMVERERLVAGAPQPVMKDGFVEEAAAGRNGRELAVAGAYLLAGAFAAIAALAYVYREKLAALGWPF
ncbi:MAG: hypothetical protein IPL47_09750 [Phyllobacteriaceae bacterium]|nr:hypothetical protein [Phyllobacteriaceae bacterium]